MMTSSNEKEEIYKRFDFINLILSINLNRLFGKMPQLILTVKSFK